MGNCTALVVNFLISNFLRPLGEHKVLLKNVLHTEYVQANVIV